MIDLDGYICLSDFRYSRIIAQREQIPCTPLLNHEETASSLTSEQSGYRAPEAILGWSVEERADVWGFGAVLYFMLFGKVSLHIRLNSCSNVMA